jgi:hypothetical protein
MSDILVDRGEINTSALAATLRQFWLIDNSFIQSRGATPTVAELLDVLETNPQIRESVRHAARVREITAPTLVAAMHYSFSTVNSEKADAFVDRLASGADLQQRHPILVLRDQLLKARGAKKFSMADAERAAWIIKAWNAFVAGREVSQLKWQQVGPRREPFPEIQGYKKPNQLAA